MSRQLLVKDLDGFPQIVTLAPERGTYPPPPIRHNHTLSCYKKKFEKKNQNDSYTDDDVTNYVKICAKLCKKLLKWEYF